MRQNHQIKVEEAAESTTPKPTAIKHRKTRGKKLKLLPTSYIPLEKQQN
jgi:hypothetical protein